MNSPHAWPETCKSLAAAIIECCARTRGAGGDWALPAALATALPQWKFRHALSRGGWYRLGDVVDGAGQRLSDDLEAWAAAALARAGGDIGRMIDRMDGQALYATRLTGRTHYFVAAAGEGAEQFLQLEIEELQELRSHRLFEHDAATLDEIVDPPGVDPTVPLGLPFYAFRRLQHIGDFLARMRTRRAETAPIHSLIEDWRESSADRATCFSHHWVIATGEHLDAFGQPRFRAQPIPTHKGTPPEFRADAASAGLALSQALTRFDREAGFPMAWYFHMLATRAVPHRVAQVVVEDALAGFAYLPERDLEVVRRWLHRPYSAR